MKTNQPQQGQWIDYADSNALLTDDPLAIEDFDHVEIYAANARQAAFFYSHGFGFTPVAYRGPETGYREAASYVLQQGKISFVITTPLRMSHEINQFLLVHGDGVKRVAFRVKSCEAFYHEAMKRGAVSVEPPTLWEDEHGLVKRAVIETYGDVQHPIIERNNYKGNFWPGFAPYNKFFQETAQVNDVGLVAIDHVVGNVEQMEPWADFYERVLGFQEMLKFTDEDISTEYSALMSKVVANGTRRVKLPINEPAEGRKKSQIEEYLEFNCGPGVQHVAMLTGDIIKTISALRKRGLVFLSVPGTYYDQVPDRVGSIDEQLEDLRKLGILVDRDEDGYLLQLFTKPVQDRPTLFFEVIQRKGSQGFGIGNFKALFESIERDQALRGNL